AITSVFGGWYLAGDDGRGRAARSGGATDALRRGVAGPPVSRRPRARGGRLPTSRRRAGGSSAGRAARRVDAAAAARYLPPEPIHLTMEPPMAAPHSPARPRAGRWAA